MIYLHVTVEGKTEQNFVLNILAPHLVTHNILTNAQRVRTSSSPKKEYRGGLMRYEVAKNDLKDWMAKDKRPESRFTTMFDFYRLPRDFPDYVKAMGLPDPYAKVSRLEMALKQDINDRRFFPYIQLHEFEALILADPTQA